MKVLKTVCAILISLVLIMSQTVFAFDPAGAETKGKCCCCACEKMTCCAAPATPSPQPVSQAPARTLSQNQIQLLAVTVSLLLNLPEPRIEKQPSVPVLSLLPISVPLYTRNCSFLI